MAETLPAYQYFKFKEDLGHPEALLNVSPHRKIVIQFRLYAGTQFGQMAASFAANLRAVHFYRIHLTVVEIVGLNVWLELSLFTCITPMITVQVSSDTKCRRRSDTRCRTSPHYNHQYVHPSGNPPTAYGKFMSAIFMEWVNNDVGNIFIRQFESFVSRFLGNGHTSCIFQESCKDNLVVESNGDIYEL